MGLAGIFKSLFSGRTDVFARYEILREAISGTMSKFYKVRDRQTGQIVGLKILDKEKTAALEARLRGVKKPTEGEIAIALDHPRIVKTFEHGLTTQDEQYLVMEYLDGPGLNSLIIAQSDRLKENCLTLLRHAAESLVATHAAGFIHRDVCPRNFVADQEASSLKLIDFGLSVPATREFTQPGNRTGTPAYMAPEVVRRRPTDRRLDIFSFAATAYEMCTFQLPWQGGTDGRAALAHSHVAATPITQFRPNLDPQLAETIMRCLAADPNHRLQTMEEVMEAIEQVPRMDASAD